MKDLHNIHHARMDNINMINESFKSRLEFSKFWYFVDSWIEETWTGDPEYLLKNNIFNKEEYNILNDFNENCRSILLSILKNKSITDKEWQIMKKYIDKFLSIPSINYSLKELE